MSALPPPHLAEELGQQLRTAREHARISSEELASRLKLQHSIVLALERGDYRWLGPPVFVRGFLRSYAREVGLPADALLPITRALRDEEPLRLALPPVRNRWIERYSLVASYLVGTALLLSALWWVVNSDGLDLARRVQPAPAPPETAVDLPLPTPVQPTRGFEPDPEADPEATAALSPTPEVAPPAPPVMAPPVMASMVPNLSRGSEFELSVQETTWVEIVDADGVRIKRDMQRAGKARYAGRPPFKLVVGNASQAKLLIAGTTIELSPFARREIARLSLVLEGGELKPQPAGERESGR